MPTYIVERVFSPPITLEQFTAAGKVLAPCIQERNVTHVASHFAQDGSRSVCIYEASDAERVREANRTAGAPFERVWTANTFSPK